mmetsp:Transcript_2239/g.3717  ORF Transcript_2239/g.3717 Transcript_2239/m.3717 type:complete len:88 (-) Transcript_2239:305-568(-)
MYRSSRHAHCGLSRHVNQRKCKETLVQRDSAFSLAVAHSTDGEHEDVLARASQLDAEMAVKLSNFSHVPSGGFEKLRASIWVELVVA